MGFSDKTVRKLRAKLNADHIRTREWNGKTLSYIEGWHALSEANRIFGFDGWNRETVELKCIAESAHRAQSPHSAYIARVRVSVRADDDVIVREGTGAGYTVAGSLAEAHALAAKEAETDATKRALSTFGNPFGLALYDREQKGVQRPRKPRPAPILREVQDSAGVITGRYADAHACAQSLVRLFEGADSVDALEAVWHHNAGVIARLQGTGTNGKANGRGVAPDQGPGTKPSSSNGNANTPGTGLDLLGAYRKRYEVLSRDARSEAAAGDSDTPNIRPNGPNTTHTDGTPGQTAAGPEEPASVDGPAPTTTHEDGAEASSRVRNAPNANSQASVAIDKSVLALPAPKRIRAPEHLKRVARMPCLICQRRPADAHHLKHVQPGAMARKPGDQWVVPLCRIHHRALHDAGDEKRWWETQKVDPIPLAEQLWSNDRPT